MLPTVESYPTRFEAEWRDYRRRARLMWIVCLSCLPLYYFFHATGTPADIWFVIYVAAVIWREFWRCPLCGNNFFCNPAYRNSFTHKCVNCSLRKWEGSSFDKKSWWEKLV